MSWLRAMFELKLNAWFCPRGDVCLITTTSPQLLIVCWLMSRSWGFEVKLDPEDRDSHVCCGKLKQWPEMPSACERLIPNSENWLTGRAMPLIPLSAAAIGDWFDLPLDIAPLGVITLEPQQGRLSVFTKQVLAVFPPAFGFVLCTPCHKRTLSFMPP